jgi:hypothetical protein
MNWTLITEAELPDWMAAANQFLERTARPPHSCPACGAELRQFMHRSGNGARGGLWIWCAGCGRHYHSSCLVPEWWSDCRGIDSEQLTDPPEYLEANWERLATPTPDSPRSTPRG